MTDLTPNDEVTRFDGTFLRLSLLYVSKIYKLLHTWRLISPSIEQVIVLGLRDATFILFWNQVSGGVN